MGTVIAGPWPGSHPAVYGHGWEPDWNGTNIVGADMSWAVRGALLRAGIVTVEALGKCSDAQVAALPRIGPKRLAEIRAWLEDGSPLRPHAVGRA
jgi:hypothetical protein